MRILLTNDDGINAPGIITLAKELEKEQEIILSAPDNQRSASGHSITLNRGLCVKEVQIKNLRSKAYSVDGTPVDCVRIGIEKLFTERPDMIISGINKGYNMGVDILYSGTVSAAIESAIYKIPAIAISAEATEDEEIYRTSSAFLKEILDIISMHEIQEGTVFNVNVPKISKDKIKGIKVCSIGNQIYKNDFMELPSESYGSYNLKGEIVDFGPENTDVHYIREGYVTVTPLHYDLTNYNTLKLINNWFI